MSTPFEFENWNRDVELGNGHELEDTETEWEAEFRPRAWGPRPVARPGIMPRRPFRPPVRRWPPVRWPRPPRPVRYPVILTQWGSWPPVTEPAFAEPPSAEPPLAEPPGAEPTAAAAADMEPPAAEPPVAQPPAGMPSGAEPSGSSGEPPSEEFYVEPEAFEYQTGYGRSVMPSHVDIQPERFEFEAELGERQLGLGEFEAARSQPVTQTSCPGYQKGEVEKSRTQPGHLPSDVIEHPRGLLIADFGVDWRTPKSSIKNSSVLKKWLTEIIQVVRANPSTKIFIIGFSDCVGKENNNAFLRRGRARKVYQLLYQLLRNTPQWKDLQSRIKTSAAPAGNYIADNSTVAGRAQNRGVLIESRRIVTMEPIDVVAPDTIERILRRALELFQRTDKWDQFSMPIPEYQRKRIHCMLLILNQPGAFDWYLTKRAVDQFHLYLDIIEPDLEHVTLYLLPDQVVEKRLKRTDREIWRDMVIVDDEIRGGILKINEYYERLQSAFDRRLQRLRDLIKKYQNNRRSIYWCYR